MILTIQPDLINAKFTGSSEYFYPYTVKHLGKITFAKVADLPDDRIRVRVAGNEAYSAADGTCRIKFKKNELVGAEYIFDRDCFI